ncbi:unnamed protein product [Adineta steineri]|uniref:Uncharacterized protein n=1 Tax=Adineta steineri TaxID=433720 RepID=A0A815CPD1_9BILA|nr:unnamed protein product [Adineta steineri]CAF1282974.1 unnamed protein product [Adineta steineri]CAF1556480.1 unnamed protein product [Adineta steineri]CAF1565566.1 unnamed protein product [Adineta steineri]
MDDNANDDKHEQRFMVRANNQVQNKEFGDAVRSCQGSIGFVLDKDQRQQLHREISGQGYGFHDIVGICIDLFG